MDLTYSRPLLQPGEPAPDFRLPAAHEEGTVSLSEYRGRSPVLLALFRGLDWHFCRRHVVLLSATAGKLEREGVQTLAVMATDARRARMFFRYRRPRMPVGADPNLTTHRAYGLPSTAFTPELTEAVQSTAAQLLRELKQPEVLVAEAYDTLGRLDGYQLAEGDAGESQRDRAQLGGQFLIDRDGVVRWANVEGARDRLAGLGQMPSDEELLAAVRAV